MTWLAIGLALFNACCFTAGTWLQYSVAAHAPSLWQAVRTPRWIAGLMLLGAGATCQVVALGLAPVTVIEPAGTLGIVLTVLFGLRVRGERLRLRTAGALAAILVGAGSFAVIAALNTVPAPIDTASLLSAGLVVAAVVVLCVLAAGALGGRARCLLLGVGGGTAYGCTSTFVRAATERFATEGLSLGLLGTLAGLGLAVFTGFYLVQRAHTAGPPESTVANLTVMDPLVAVAIGIGLLGEAPGLTAPTALLGLSAAIVAIGGVVLLYRTVPGHVPAFAPPSLSLRQETSCPPSAS